jgi:hypothetical protein
MLPSYPAGAAQDDASLEQDVYTVPRTLAPCDGVPNSHQCEFNQDTISECRSQWLVGLWH